MTFRDRLRQIKNKSEQTVSKSKMVRFAHDSGRLYDFTEDYLFRRDLKMDKEYEVVFFDGSVAHFTDRWTCNNIVYQFMMEDATNNQVESLEDLELKVKSLGDKIVTEVLCK